MEWKISVLNPGDHIRVKRDHYNHHGVYVGNNEVVHYTANDGDGLNKASEVFVQKTSVEFFLKDGVAEIAVYSRKEKRRLNKVDDIIKLANASLGRGDYNVINNNCETFANEVTFKKHEKNERKHAFRHFVLRFFIKFTGIFAFWVYVKPKYYYQSKKAKKESKNLKGGAIIVANHTSIFDAYLFIFRHLFKIIHTMVADVVYKSKALIHMCNAFEMIKIDRNDPSNIKAYDTAKKYLNRGKSVLVFPEGHLEDEKGKIEDVKASAIKLAFETKKPIIPYYIKGNYGMFKRAKVIAGEKIYIHELIKKDTLDAEDIKYLQGYIKEVLTKLKHQLSCYEEYKTKALISKRTYVQDIMRITSMPLGYLAIRARKVYIGDKKKVKAAMKEKVLLAPNHSSFYDVVFMYLYFLRRRVRIVAISDIWNVKFLGKLFDRSGVIKYNREAKNGFDLRAFKEVSGVLEGNGAVVLFPQGHISENGIINEPLKPGIAVHSIRQNAPVIPIIFADKTQIFKKNRILIGDPLYPMDYIKKENPLDEESINNYLTVIYNKMLELQSIAPKYSRDKKKAGKTKWIQKLN